MTTVSPLLTAPTRVAVLRASAVVAAGVSRSSKIIGRVPQDKVNWFAVWSSNVIPNSGTFGRKRATLRTVLPQRLRQIIALASVSDAVRAAAIVSASVTLRYAASFFDLLLIACICAAQAS